MHTYICISAEERELSEVEFKYHLKQQPNNRRANEKPSARKIKKGKREKEEGSCDALCRG
jgi:hypothetical protein